MRSALARHRGWLAVLAVLVIFTATLFLWAGRASTGYSAPLSVIPPSPAVGPDQPAPTRTGAVPRHDTAHPVADTAPGDKLVLPPFATTTGNDVQNAPHGRHQVVITVTSDKSVLQLSYAVRKGSADYRTYVQAPLHIESGARGDGVVAEIGAQANVDATYVTCAVRVDGVLTAHNRAKGPYGVAFCVA